MKKAISLSSAIVLIFSFLMGCSLLKSIQPILAQPSQAHQVPTPPSTLSPQQQMDWQRIDKALQETIRSREDVLAYLIYEIHIDRIVFSDDGDLALVWLIMYDPEAEDFIASEPGLAIARRTQEPGEEEAGWKISLQADPDWAELIQAVPAGMISDEDRAHYMPNVQKEPKEHLVLSGYRLPWKAGEAKRVSGSIGHVFVYKTCPSTCLYAFDFADGTMFPILAARGGRVKYAVWRYPNGTHESTNFIVLEDTSTNPTTYQVYYHLAQDSIPAELRVAGAEVVQGQFIGNADNTGASTGHHLHFMVHTNSASYWGNSVDITFDDVTVNGGRPRTCAEAQQFPGYGAECQAKNLYVSSNGDDELPTGKITSPPAGTVIKDPILTVSGQASDDTGVASIEVFITTDGTWAPVGSLISAAQFTTQIDLCQAGIPDGNLFLTLKVTDTAGKTTSSLTALTQYVKQYDCSPPPKVCEPGPGQVAIYNDANFAGGCEVLNTGEYARPDQLGEVGENNLESLRLGKDIYVELYAEPDFGGNNELFMISDANLNSNKIGGNQVSSMKIIPMPQLPDAPRLEAPLNRDGQSPADQDELTLVWYGSGDAPDGGPTVDYKSELKSSNDYAAVFEWQKQTSWAVGKLPAGEYTWTVYARNIKGFSQTTMQFKVGQINLAPLTHLEAAPKDSESTAVQLNWKVDLGEEDIRSFDIQYRYNGGEWQDWNLALPGYLRNAWFVGSPGGSYEFRMRGVDSAGLAEEYPPTAESVITFAPLCKEDEFENARADDDEPAGASPLDPGQDKTHNLCSLKDVDWLIFPAESGKSYKMHTRPISGNAAAAIRLVATDGSTILGEAFPKDFNQPAEFQWTAPQTGLYYLRTEAYDAGLSGTDVRYRVGVDPVGQVYQPGLFCSGLALPAIWFLVKAYMKRREEKESRNS